MGEGCDEDLYSYNYLDPRCQRPGDSYGISFRLPKVGPRASKSCGITALPAAVGGIYRRNVFFSQSLGAFGCISKTNCKHYPRRSNHHDSKVFFSGHAFVYGLFHVAKDFFLGGLGSVRDPQISAVRVRYEFFEKVVC